MVASSDIVSTPWDKKSSIPAMVCILLHSLSYRYLSLSPGCTNNITTSDHSPVFSTFQIGGVKQFTSGLLVYLYCTLDISLFFRSAHAPSTHIDPKSFIIISQCNAKVCVCVCILLTRDLIFVSSSRYSQTARPISI